MKTILTLFASLTLACFTGCKPDSSGAHAGHGGHHHEPPHGGMAAGIERMVMLLTGCKTVRDVAIFPMNQQANDLLMGAPSEVTTKQLRELSIRVNAPEKK